MPRHLDPQVEKRVLDAAQKLWRSGDKKLSMRALARAAGTNTPGIYRRFRGRKDILRALLWRFQEELYEFLVTSETLEEAAERYIDFALRRPKEYEMWFAQRHELLRHPTSRRVPLYEGMGPTFPWAQRKLAEQFGGSPQQHTQLVLAIWGIVHGTTALLISKAVPEQLVEETRSACRRAVGMLIQQGLPGEASFLESKSGHTRRLRLNL